MAAEEPLPPPESPPPPPPPASAAAAATTTIDHLPEEILHHIFSHLSLRQIFLSRSISRSFLAALTSPSFLALHPSLPLLALRHPRRHRYHSHQSSPADTSTIYAFDPSLDQWLRFPLFFLPFPSSPVTASPSIIHLWADADESRQGRSLVLCNPLTQSYRVLPQLGSAWSRHGTVLAGSKGDVLVLSELAALFYSPQYPDHWLKFSLNLPSKPRSPILVGDDTVYAICDVGSPWRCQWKLFYCRLPDLGRQQGWDRLEKNEWGDVFDILKRPRLIKGSGSGRILMIGGLRTNLAVDAPCSTVLILRLDLVSLEWDEAGRMPEEMYKCFGLGAAGGNNKVKVFGGDGMVWFSGKKVRGRMAMWREEKDEVVGKGSGGVWRWVEGVPGYGDGVYRGFTFNASLTAAP